MDNISTRYEVWGGIDARGIALMMSPKGPVGFGEIDPKKGNWPEEIKLHALIKRGYHFHARAENGLVVLSLIAPSFASLVSSTPGGNVALSNGKGQVQYVDRLSHKTIKFFKYFGEATDFYIVDQIAVGVGESLDTALINLTQNFDSILEMDCAFPWKYKIPPTQIGDQVFDGDTNDFDGRFIKPNEGNPFLFEPVMRGKKGALISVGTVRLFIDAVLGDFDLVIGFDISHAITMFNLHHQALITQIDDLLNYTTAEKRLLYLLALKGLWPKDEEELRKLMRSKPDIHASIASDSFFYSKGHKTPPASIAKAISYMLACDELNPRNKDRYESTLRRSIASPRKASYLGCHSSLLEAYYPVGQDKEILAEKRTIAYFWESDEAWEKLVSYFRAEKIKYITGDLTNLLLIGKLERALTYLQIDLSVLDPSNAIIYFQDEIRQFAEAFLGFHCAPDAVIAITYSSIVDSWIKVKVLYPSTELGHDLRWTYKAEDLKTYLKKLSGFLRARALP